MRTILITGGAGFVGSHVAERCLESGYRVVVIDNLSSGCRENVPPDAEFCELDINDPELSLLVSKIRPDAVVHLAAQASVAKSVDEPDKDAAVNILGTLRVLEAARMSEVRNVVFASSAAVYGAPRVVPITESCVPDPVNPYGVAKLTAERYIRVYCSLYGFRAVVARFANVFGPRQRAEGDGGVVAKFLGAMVRGDRPVVYGDGHQSRDFIYVKDVAEAIYQALQYLFAREQPDFLVANISTGESISLLELLKLLRELIPGSLYPEHRPPRVGDIQHSCLDNSLAKQTLGWYPKYSLSEALEETLAWTRLRNASMRGDMVVARGQ